MDAKILCVYDEGALEMTSHIGAKGTSFLIDADDRRILFNAGLRARYLTNNLDCRDIDVDSIDTVVVSCIDNDMTGGIEAILDRKEPVKLITMPTPISGKKKMLFNKGLCIPEEYKDMIVPEYTDSWYQISEHVFLSPPISTPKGPESFLVINGRKDLIVVAGATYCGPEIAMNTVRDRFGKYPSAYIGGVDLGKKQKVRAQEMADAFSKAGCMDLHLNHTTTPDGMTMLRVHLGLNNVKNLYVGMSEEYPL